MGRSTPLGGRRPAGARHKHRRRRADGAGDGQDQNLDGALALVANDLSRELEAIRVKRKAAQEALADLQAKRGVPQRLCTLKSGANGRFAQRCVCDYFMFPYNLQRAVLHPASSGRRSRQAGRADVYALSRRVLEEGQLRPSLCCVQTKPRAASTKTEDTSAQVPSRPLQHELYRRRAAGDLRRDPRRARLQGGRARCQVPAGALSPNEGTQLPTVEAAPKTPLTSVLIAKDHMFGQATKGDQVPGIERPHSADHLSVPWGSHFPRLQ